MHAVDITIIILYFLLMIAVGWFVAKKAARNPESYFLAGKSLPWWMIGIAHGSSGVDISGTMWFVMVLFVYGVKGVWLLWVWPLFNVIFRMAYLGTWVRRSNVLTGAEWMYTRFGRNTGSELAYLSIVAYALVSVVGFLSMAYIGIGKFTASFIPLESLGISAASLPGSMTPADFFAIVSHAVAGVYCVVGGMYSVVMNDMIQFALIVIAAIIIGVIAITTTSSEQILAAVPAGWDHMFFGWRLDLDWSGLIPKLNDKLYNPDRRRRRRLLDLRPVCPDALPQGRARQHGRPNPQLRHPARPLDPQPARGRAREPHDGHRLAGPAVPAHRRHRHARHRLLRTRAAADGGGRQGRFRADPAQRREPLPAHRLPRG